jgi:hypothetical protein
VAPGRPGIENAGLAREDRRRFINISFINISLQLLILFFMLTREKFFSINGVRAFCHWKYLFFSSAKCRNVASSDNSRDPARGCA